MRLQERLGVKLDPRPVPLEPFGHQVAGQASMLTLNESTVCKPMIPREHRLYCSLPPSLRPFTPQYWGVLYVRLEEGDDGSLNLWGYRPLTEDDARVDNSEVLRLPPLTDDLPDSDKKGDRGTKDLPPPPPPPPPRQTKPEEEHRAKSPPPTPPPRQTSKPEADRAKSPPPPPPRVEENRDVTNVTLGGPVLINKHPVYTAEDSSAPRDPVLEKCDLTSQDPGKVLQASEKREDAVQDPADSAKVSAGPPHKNGGDNHLKAADISPPGTSPSSGNNESDNRGADDSSSEGVDGSRGTTTTTTLSPCSEVRVRDVHRVEVRDSSAEDAERPAGKGAVTMTQGGGRGVRGEEGHVQLVAVVPSGRDPCPVSGRSGQDVPSAVDQSPPSFPSRPSSGCVVRLTEDGEYEVTAGRASDSKFSIAGDDHAPPPPHQQTASESNPGLGEAMTTQPLNPWGLNLHKRLLEKMRKSEPSVSGYPFLILENVVARFSQPCILDLKVGSRLFGDDASPNKIASQSRKCNITTSRSLGLRLCGMQVYQETTATYNSLDKFYGRTLTDDTFYHVLRAFLHNGRELRRELLAPIVARLHALIDCLKGLNSFRFYASSLLIMYDGLSTDNQRLAEGTPGSGSVGGSARATTESGKKNSGSVGKGMHAAAPESNATSQSGKKEGAKVPPISVSGGRGGGKGTSVDQRCERESSDAGVQPSSSPVAGRHGVLRPSGVDNHPSPACSGTQGGTSDVYPGTEMGVVENGGGGGQNRRSSDAGTDLSLVDVRMIDFAHTTHSGFHDNVTHEGPDGDYIWGLENLTRMFTRLQTECE